MVVSNCLQDRDENLEKRYEGFKEQAPASRHNLKSNGSALSNKNGFFLELPGEVYDLCWASGRLTSSGRQDDTGLSRKVAPAHRRQLSSCDSFPTLLCLFHVASIVKVTVNMFLP